MCLVLGACTEEIKKQRKNIKPNFNTHCALESSDLLRPGFFGYLSSVDWDVISTNSSYFIFIHITFLLVPSFFWVRYNVIPKNYKKDFFICDKIKQ